MPPPPTLTTVARVPVARATAPPEDTTRSSGDHDPSRGAATRGPSWHGIPDAVLADLQAPQMPAMPQVLHRFLDAVSDGRTPTHELARLVKLDPALTARFLALAHSSAVAHAAELRRIEDVLDLLGPRMVKTIAMAMAARAGLVAAEGPLAPRLEGFWRHSLRVAILCRRIAAEVGTVSPEEAYLAGLLHDIGQLVLLDGLGPSYGDLLSEDGHGPTQDDREAVLDATERAALGTDHGTVGAWLIDRWSLPSSIADAVWFHHLPAERVTGTHPLVTLLWAAHACSLVPAPGMPEWAAVWDAAGLLGMDAERLVQLCTEAADEVDAEAIAWGVAPVPHGHTLPEPVAEARGGSAVPSADRGLQARLSMQTALQPVQHRVSEFGSEAELLQRTCASARILFGIEHVAFFLVDDEISRLVVAPLPGQPSSLTRLEIGLPGSGGLCVDAARHGVVCGSFDAGPQGATALADLQILRALGQPGLLCLPMSTPDRRIGVMVCGISVERHQALREHGMPALIAFANGVGACVDEWRALRERDAHLEVEITDRFRLHGRQLAHEVGNPLGIIKNYLAILDKRMGASAAPRGELDILREEIDRVAGIVRQLAEPPSVAPMAPGTLERVDLNGLLEGLRALYGESLFGPAGVSLDLRLQPRCQAVTADAAALKQVVLNLWKNAAEALPRGARVTVTTVDDLCVQGHLFGQVCIRDNGPGLPPEVFASLFRPHPHRRRPGHSGLGLSIVNGLVSKMGGHLSGHSRAGDGTTFEIRLPQARRNDP